MRAHGAFRGEQARWAIACALVTAAAVAVAGEPTAPARPPAVRPERPRLFLTPATAAALPARARGELAWIYRDRIIRDCDAPFDERRVEFTLGNADYLLARGLSLLLTYRIERREEYKSRAMSLVNGLRSDGAAKTRRDVRLRMQFLAIAYDWLYDALSAEERSALRTLLADAYRKEAGVLSKTDDDFVSGYSHFTTTSLVIAALSLCDGTGEYEAELDRALRHWEGFLDVARKVGADGGQHLGWRYGRSYAARVAWVTEAITTATGVDRFAAERPWLSQLGYHLVYGLRPDMTYLRVGDTHREIAINLKDDLVLLGILSARYRDPHLAGCAALILDEMRRNRALAVDPQFAFALLCFDPTVERKSLADLPLDRAFTHAGNFVMRTGWGPDDTVVAFRAMPWYHFNHEHRDFGSFLVYFRGGLAVHGGAYMAGDDDSLYGGPHLRNYAWRTVAHNTITVFDPNERFCSPFGAGHERCEGDNRWSNDGGQKIRSRVNDDVPLPRFQPQSAADIDDPRFAQGKLLAYEAQDAFTYVAADGTSTYRRDKVTLFERHLFFLRKVAGRTRPVLAVLDRVRAAKAEFNKAWNLHVVEEPRIDGRSFVARNRTRVRLTGGPRARQDDTWFQYSGKLDVETLLPADAQVVFVGGPGKEFWVNGMNYPAEIRENDWIQEPGIGRVEVRPGSPREEDTFLHVLSPAPSDDTSPRPEARVLQAAGATVFRIGDQVIAVCAARAAEGPVTYTVDAPAECLHVVAGLRPGASVRIGGAGAGAPAGRASAQGVLVFRRSGAGEIRLEPN